MNRTRLFSAIFGLFLAGTLSLAAQEAGEEVTGQGVLEVVSEHNWGVVAPGKLEAEVAITNVGEGPLQIENVRPSCGCTTAPLDDYLLDPGQTTMMHVTLDASRREGNLSKSIVIYSDDPNNPTKIVKLVADVQRDIAFEPDVQYLIFQNATVGEETTASIRVTNRSSEPLTIFAPEMADPDAAVSFNLQEEMVLEPGAEFLLVATTTPTTADPIAATATFRTSSKNTPTREFKLYGQVTAVTQATEVEAVEMEISAAAEE